MESLAQDLLAHVAEICARYPGPRWHCDDDSGHGGTLSLFVFVCESWRTVAHHVLYRRRHVLSPAFEAAFAGELAYRGRIDVSDPRIGGILPPFHRHDRLVRRLSQYLLPTDCASVRSSIERLCDVARRVAATNDVLVHKMRDWLALVYYLDTGHSMRGQGYCIGENSNGSPSWAMCANYLDNVCNVADAASHCARDAQSQRATVAAVDRAIKWLKTRYRGHPRSQRVAAILDWNKRYGIGLALPRCE